MASFDAHIVLWLNGFVGTLPPLDAAVRVVVSDYLTPVAAALALLWLWLSGRDTGERRGRQHSVMCAVVALGLANLAVELINDFYARPRPFAHLDLDLLFYRPPDPSFPANVVVVVATVAAAVRPAHTALGAAIFLASVVVGVARIYAGVFYPTDVLAGLVLGVGMGLLSARLVASLRPIPELAIRIARVFCLA